MHGIARVFRCITFSFQSYMLEFYNRNNRYAIGGSEFYCTENTGVKEQNNNDVMMLMTESRVVSWYFNLRFDVGEGIQSSSFNEKMSCRISAGLVPFLVLQWLSLAEASHFRHGVIMWAPADSYSNTV